LDFDRKTSGLLWVIAKVVRFYYDAQFGAEEVNVTTQAMRSAEADLER
jgi:hypothetical protein